MTDAVTQYLMTLSDEELAMVEAGDIGGLSDSSLDGLEAAIAQQGMTPQEPQQQFFPPQEQYQNSIGALAKQFGIEDYTNVLEGVGEFTMGVKRSGQSFANGLAQLAGTPEEAAALAKIEEAQRAQFAAYDEGLGAEDIGEGLAFVGTMAMPGANALKVAATGGKIMAAVRALAKGAGKIGDAGRTVGGNAILMGLIEGMKGITDDESRLKNSLETAALGYAGGKVLQAPAGVLSRVWWDMGMGRTLGQLGLGALSGNSGRRVVGENIMRRLQRSLFNVDKPSSELRRAVGARNNPQVRSTIKAEADAAAAAARANMGVEPGDPVWDAWVDIVKGTKSPKTGRRLRSSGLEGGGVTKAAKENPKLDVLKERNRIVSTLLGAARGQLDDGTVFFNRKALAEAYEGLTRNAKFREMYGRTNKDGSWTPTTKVGKQLDSFVSELFTGPQGGDLVTAEQIYRKATEELIQHSDHTAQMLADLAGKKGKVKDAAMSRIMGQVLAGSSISQSQFLAEVEEAVGAGDWFGLIDGFETLEEAVEKYRGNTN